MKRNRILAAFFGLILVVGITTPVPAFATATATIHGIVRMPDGSVPDVEPSTVFCGENATVYGCGGLGQTWTYDSTTGAYSFAGLSAGKYQIEFVYYGAKPNVVTTVYWDGDSQSGPYVDVAAGENVLANISYLEGAVVAGHLTGINGPLTNGTITLMRDGTPYPIDVYLDAATQTYRQDRLAAGDYTVEFRAYPYPVSYWNGKNSLATATKLSLTAGQTVTGVDAVLGASSSIAGHLYADDGTGPVARSGYVDLVPVPAQGGSYPLTTSDASGAFEFDNVESGTYRVCAEGFEQIIGNCWGGGDETTAPTITITAGQVITGKDITVMVGGVITATVETRERAGDPTVALAGADVDLWKLNDARTLYDFFKELTTDTGGNVSAEQLPVGTYRIEFRDPTGNHSSEWWNSKRYFADGEDIVVGTNSTTDLGEVVLLGRTLDVYRTSGDDRFFGAVKMTQAIWPRDSEVPGDGGVPDGGVPIIYIANGLNYPDALSAGPAAIFQQGALLLVWPTSIPDAVKAELTRLKPQKIVIVGGPASVSDGVMSQLRQLVSDPDDVTRQSGIDRFEASRNLARSVFGGPHGPGAPTVFISTGLNFPDALDAGPPAGLIGAPVILVNGSLPALDLDTVQLLSDLHTINVFIAGGPGSVSTGIEAEITTLMGADHVYRFTGETRYEAAAAINEWFFPTTETAFLATGANFPDALAGAPLAGAVQGPIYLSQPGCIPQIVISQIRDGDTQGLWLLGGPASISPAVEDLTVCAS
jgi:putative cell wall-binding protein